MAAGDYIPKYKTGQTVLSEYENDMEYIIIATYRGIGEFNIAFRNNPDFDERDDQHLIYAVYNEAHADITWRREQTLTLYCSNSNRGKKILLKPDALSRIRFRYSLSDESLEKMKTTFKHQPPET